jgi:aerobic carbon-monoxide dehydrogenase medium subunit
VYDENGQLMTSSLMEYAVPKADFVPTIELDRTETPTDVNPLGIKGAGETGTIASTPAVVNAVMDALAPLGIRHTRHAADAGARLDGDARGEELSRHVHTASSRVHVPRPTSLDEAIGLLAKNGDTRPLAGGHSLLPMMKLRLAEPQAIVDIGRIAGLDGIEVDGDELRIGAMATHASVAASEVVRSRCRVLATTAEGIGDRQVRNRGTIGGSLAHADPGADYPTVVTALGATIVVQGPGGEREIAADDFFTGVFTTALEQGELVTEVRVPAVERAAYVKHRHPASGYAVAAVACVLRDDEARLVVGGVTGMPVRVSEAEQVLIGIAPVDEEKIASVAADVPAALSGAIGDKYASAEYRIHLAHVLANRAIKAALEAT